MRLMREAAKRLLTVVLVVLLICGTFVWDMPEARADNGPLSLFTEGDGTESMPYGVSTPEQLDAVRNDLDAHYKLLNDIDMTAATSLGGAYYNAGEGFAPIGTYASPFRGEFDGNEYAIIGLNQKRTGSLLWCGGLFGRVNSGYIHDLGMVSGSIEIINTDIYSCAGGIAGYLDSATVENCYNTGYVGNSTPDTMGGGIAGGIAGNAVGNSVIKNCYNTGSVNSDTVAGGIVGQMADNSLVDHCYNTGDMDISNESNSMYASTIGGITGSMSGNGIQNSYNSGNITFTNNSSSPGYMSVGGIAGRTDSGTISDSHNSGNISSTGLCATGGLTGFLSNCTISNCHNTGMVSGIGKGADGGIAGLISQGEVQKCYNTGQIDNLGSADGFFNAGGIAGTINEGEIHESFNKGNINNNCQASSYATYTGGIAGEVMGSVIDNSYNVGDISSRLGSYAVTVGGIVGTLYGDTSSTLEKCYNLGNVTGYANTGYSVYIGGISGSSGSGIKSHCYFLDRTPNGDGNWSYTGVTSITQEQAAQQATFTGFDFAAVWTLEGNGTYIFPELQGNPMEGVYVTNVTVTSQEDTVMKTATLQMGVDVLPADAENSDFRWSVTFGTGRAVIDQSGMLTATKNGTVTVTATSLDGKGIIGYDGATGSKVITVTPLLVSSITVTSPTDTVVKAHTLQMSVSEVLPADADDKTYTWSVENGTGEATIDTNGLLTAIKAGTVTVWATANDGSGTAGSKSITINSIAVGNILVTSGDTTVKKGETMQMAATVSPENADDKGVIWSIEESTGEADIDENGLLTAKKVGVVIVKATARDGSGINGIKEITILGPDVSSVTLDRHENEMVLGGTFNLVATISPNDAEHPEVTWSSSDNGIATVDQNGVVTGRGDGTVIITATADGQSATCTVRVRGRFDVNATANNGGYGSVSGSGSYAIGTSVTLNASPKTGYRFVRWTENGAKVSSNARYTFTVTRDVMLVAEFTPNVGVTYQSHVQDIGWQSLASNGGISGTSGQSLRLEGIRVNLTGISSGVQYKTHVQNIGWMDWVSDGAMSGTSGQSLRLEAICIRLNGLAGDLYDIYYRVHAQEFGWMGWAKNGAQAGTAGYAYRLEAIEIKLVPKGGAAPGSTNNAFSEKGVPSGASVKYQSHVQDVGWQDWKSNGEASGTSGQSLRLEGMRVQLSGVSGGVQYQTHVQDIGWMDWVSNGEMSGTSGRSLRLEAINIRLAGDAAAQYDIYYRVHAQNFGWLDWAKNGASSGTAGFSYRLEAIEIKLVPKGQPAPGSTSRPFVNR